MTSSDIETQEENSTEMLPSLDEFFEAQARETLASKQQTLAEGTRGDSVIEIPVAIQRERTRTYLAFGLLGLLFLSLIGIGAYILFDTLSEVGPISQEKSNAHRELITIIWTSQVTLVSGALGYYFGSERNNVDSRSLH